MKISRFVSVAVCLVLLGACTNSHRAAHPTPSPSASAPPPAGTLVVLASSPLKQAFDDIGARFGTAHPGVTYTATYQGSQALVTAIQAGGQGDVFASTDAASMTTLVSAGAVVSSTVAPFARNALEIVVPAGNPRGIQSLADLAKPGVTVVLADPSLPAGKDAVQALALAGIRVTPKSTVATVALMMTTVLSGKADAGIAFQSDVVVAGSGVTGVAIPAASNVEETYQIGVLRGAPNATTANAFVQFVRSDAGRAILTAAGFQPA